MDLRKGVQGLTNEEMKQRRGFFFGVAGQLAARICNKVESSQVLVSSIVKELCMGKSITFKDLGQSELKGFSTPIVIAEAGWD